MIPIDGLVSETTTTAAGEAAPTPPSAASPAPAAPAAVTDPGVVSMVEISVQPLERSRLEPHAEAVRKLAEWCPRAWWPGARSRPSAPNVDAASLWTRADSVRARTTPHVSEEIRVPTTSPLPRADSVGARTITPVSDVKALTAVELLCKVSTNRLPSYWRRSRVHPEEKVESARTVVQR